MKRISRLIIISVGLFLCSTLSFSQNVGISEATITPDASAILELRSTTRGLLVPRLALTQTTSAAPVTSPATSLLVYNTATVNDVTPGFYYWSGSAWVRILSGTLPTTGWALVGNAGTNPATNFLGTTDNQPLVIRTNNTERIRVLSTGNVGIGTTTPAAQLHTTGTVRFANYPSGVNGAIVRTNANGDLSITNFSGNATDVLLGNGTFGPAPAGAAGWLLTGNTLAGTEFIGSVNGQPFVMRTNNTERSRILSAGNFLVNTTTAIDAGDAFTVVVSPTFTTAVAAYGNGGYPVWAEQQNIDADAVCAVNTAATGAGAGCGLVGVSAQTGGAGVWGDGGTTTRGVIGINNVAAYAGVQAQNINAGGDGLYAVNSAANGAGAGSAIYAASGQTGGPTIGATMQSTTVYTNSAISGVTSTNGNGVIGASSLNTGTGMRGLNSAANGTAIGFGGFFSSGQSGGAALVGSLQATSYFANAAISGFAADAIASSRGVMGGCNNATGVGVWGQSTGTTADGVLGIVTQIDALAVNGQNLSTDGTGIAGAGNNQAPQLLLDGSGGAFSGDIIGTFGYASGSANNTWGGYFSNGGGASYAYVGGRGTGTNYKVLGNGTASTIISRPDNSKAVMFCPEAPEILFQDKGTGQLVNGRAYIQLDEVFANSIYVDDQYPLSVFVQLEGDCNGVYVTNKTANGFEVVELQGGQSNVKFSWLVYGNRKDSYDDQGNLESKHVGVRLPDAPLPMETKEGRKHQIEVPQQLNENSRPVEKQGADLRSVKSIKKGAESK